jgi:septum formation protein
VSKKLILNEKRAAPSLVLASTSVYRRDLLSRLGLAFTQIAPAVNETALTSELPTQTALRVAEAKARAVANRAGPNSLIIGSDQVAELDGELIGKPLTHKKAAQQLLLLSGKTANFHTALVLLNADKGKTQAQLVSTAVRFRSLSAGQIERYLRREQPYDCAGSAKVEGLGIALLESVEGADSTALIGLPLIALVSMLRNEGIEVL